MQQLLQLYESHFTRRLFHVHLSISFFTKSSKRSHKNTYFYPGIMMDACIRVLSPTEEIRGIACISFLKDELLDPSGINDDNVDAYMFLIDSSGKYYYIFDLVMRFP